VTIKKHRETWCRSLRRRASK